MHASALLAACQVGMKQRNKGQGGGPRCGTSASAALVLGIDSTREQR